MSRNSKTLFYSLFFLLGSALLKAQSQYVLDSLNNLLAITKSDTAKAMLYADIANEHDDIKSMRECINKGLALSIKHNYKRSFIWNKRIYGRSLEAEKKYSEAEELYDSLQNYVVSPKDKKTTANLLIDKARISLYKKANDQAVKHLFAALKIGETYNYKSVMCAAYYRLGNIYLNTGNQEQIGAGYYEKALELTQETYNWKVELSITHFLSHYKARYGTFNNVKNSVSRNEIQNLDEVLGYAKKASNIAVKYKTGEAAEYTTCVAKFYLDAGRYQKALTILEEAKDYHLKSKDKDDLIMYYLILGNTKRLLERTDDAVEDYYTALDYAEQSQNHSGISQAAGYLSFIYEKKENYMKAYEYFRLWNDERVLANSENDNKAIFDLRAQYNDEKREHQFALLTKDKALQSLLLKAKSNELIEKQWQNAQKEAKIELLGHEKNLAKKEEQKREIELKLSKEHVQNQQLEIKRQKAVRLLLFGGLAVSILAIFFVMRGYFLKKKANQIITKQKQEVEFQKSQVDQKNKEITDSINYAKNLQESILPMIEEIDQSLNCFVLYQPKDIVAGDFYFFKQLNDNEVILAAGDCTGHGVPGALTSVICSQKLHEVIDKGFTQPSEILTEVNKEIKKVFRKKLNDGMDIALIKFNRQTRSIVFAGANRPLIVINNKDLHEHKGVKSGIGHSSLSDEAFKQTEINLSEGDMVYMFSDGYADQFGGERNKKLSTKKLKEFLIETSSFAIHHQKKYLQDAFNNWKHMLDQIDDVLVIGVKA